MTDLLGGMMEGLGKLVAEEATKLLNKENISEVSRQFFANSNISVNILASVFGAAILFGFFLLYLLLVNPAGFWGAMMDEMVGYMSGRGHSVVAYGSVETYPAASAAGYSAPSASGYEGSARSSSYDNQDEEPVEKEDEWGFYPELRHRGPSDLSANSISHRLNPSSSLTDSRITSIDSLHSPFLS